MLYTGHTAFTGLQSFRYVVAQKSKRVKCHIYFNDWITFQCLGLEDFAMAWMFSGESPYCRVNKNACNPMAADLLELF